MKPVLLRISGEGEVGGDVGPVLPAPCWAIESSTSELVDGSAESWGVTNFRIGQWKGGCSVKST
jgi:hypothetical protein